MFLFFFFIYLYSIYSYLYLHWEKKDTRKCKIWNVVFISYLLKLGIIRGIWVAVCLCGSMCNIFIIIPCLHTHIFIFKINTKFSVFTRIICNNYAVFTYSTIKSYFCFISTDWRKNKNEKPDKKKKKQKQSASFKLRKLTSYLQNSTNK